MFSKTAAADSGLKKVEGISDIRDESDRNGLRIVVEINRDAMANVVLSKLYKYTPLQNSYGVNNIALVKGRPELLNLKQQIELFIEFRLEVIVRRTQFDLDKAEARARKLIFSTHKPACLYNVLP
jgi:DNA gyrase subunit A